MPIQHAIWKVGTNPVALTSGALASEQQLEDMIVATPAILSSEWMLIGRQEATAFGGRIDLLAIAPDASLVLIELKRDKTPRELVAQALDYASWVEQLTADKIVQIFQRFSKGGHLADAFKQFFGTALDEEQLNLSHQIVVVAAELDASSERIVSYLNARDIAINVLCFRVFQFGTEQLLSRAWLVDPIETQVNTGATNHGKNTKEPWNGEFYVSFGDLQERSWKDAMRFGYISAGGGTWYTRSLAVLSPGDRVWVNIPKTGYVAVGLVKESMRAISELNFETPEGVKPALDVLEHASLYAKRRNDPNLAEYAVLVDWQHAVEKEKAVNELGLFGNQNTVCRPATPKWRHTVERLKTQFGIED